ncbi:MAG: DUF4097 family beta strand repeat-containing protein [Mycoplasmatales bacterium]
MNYFKTTVVSIIFILIIIQFNPLGYSTQTDKFNEDTDQIKNINIDLNDVDVEIYPTQANTIIVEHSYNKSDLDESEVFSLVNDNTLNVHQYDYDKDNHFQTKEKITLFIPEENNIENVNVINKQGNISVENLNQNKSFLSTQTGSIKIVNSSFKYLKTLNQEKFLNINNVIADRAQITSNGKEFLSTNLTSKEAFLNVGDKTQGNFKDMNIKNLKLETNSNQLTLSFSNLFKYKVISDNKELEKKFDNVKLVKELSDIDGTDEVYYFDLSKAQNIKFNLIKEK